MATVVVRGVVREEHVEARMRHVKRARCPQLCDERSEAVRPAEVGVLGDGPRPHEQAEAERAWLAR